MCKADNLEVTLGSVDVRVDLSAPQDSVTGRVLHKLMYNNTPLYELAPNPSGCPHNGGEHTFSITGHRREVNAWLDLLSETYPEVGIMVVTVKRKIHKEFLSGSWRRWNRINVKLKDLQYLELKPYQDKPIAVKWFQSEPEQLAPADK